MDTLNATTPHYVRCIKPNDDRLPFQYDSRRVVQQLRACGVLETIRISSQSYPSRWTYTEFYSRYSILMSPEEKDPRDKKQTCAKVLQRLIQDGDQYQLGRTKIFFRAGQVAYLEKLRLDRLRGSCVTIQKNFRSWRERRKYLRMRDAALVLQDYIRGKRTVRKSVSAAALKQGWAAVVLQTRWRGYRTRQIYQVVRLASITVQAFTRGWLARRRYHQMLREHKAVVLQKFVRAWLVRRRFQIMRRLVINVQLCFRVHKLRAKVEEQNKENSSLLEKLGVLKNTHTHTLNTLALAEQQLQKSTEKITTMTTSEEKNREQTSLVMDQLRKEVDGLILEKQDLQEELKRSVQVHVERLDQIKATLLDEREDEVRLRKIAENKMELTQMDHEKELELLKEEIKKLREEKIKLQGQIHDEGQVTSDLQEQVLQLSKHVKVIPELRRDLNNLQNQRDTLDRKMKEQSQEATARMKTISRRLVAGVENEDVMLSLMPEDSQKIQEDEDLLASVHVLHEATTILEKHQKKKKDDHETRVEGLKVRVDHLENENSKLQKMFQEKSNVTENILDEMSRLSGENSVIPQLRLQLSDLQRHKQEVEDTLEEQKKSFEERSEEVTTTLQRQIQDQTSQRRRFEDQAAEMEAANMDLQGKVQELREENEYLRRQQLMENEVKGRLRQETSQLTAENMDLEEQLDQRDRLVRKLQNQIKSLEKAQKAKKTPVLPKAFLGMLEYKREDEARLIQNCILELKPKGVAVNMMPVLPALLLFMCVRHTDYLKDDDKVKSLMNAIIGGVKKVILSFSKDAALLCFWLSNTHHLLNLLKQYSGEQDFMTQNTPRQNKNCLQNYDLSEYRQILSDLAIHIYHQFISVMEKSLSPAIVPGLLEHESLQGISSMKPAGVRKRSSSIYEEETFSVTFILQQLTHFHSIMVQHGLDAALIQQVVKQLFYVIGATSLNSILLRKDLCSCRKGMQIRCNISYLDEWLKDQQLLNSQALETLQPLSQLAWLLQVSKSSDADAQEITQTCSQLRPVQIVKILNSYTPIDDFEKRVSSSFVRKVQSLLQTRERSTQLLLDLDYRFQVTFPFSWSSQALELLQVPSSLQLPFLTRV